MTTAAFEVRYARPTELPDLAALCADGFTADPFTAWTHPDEAARRALLPIMFGAALAEAEASGTVLVAISADGARLGTSIWLTPSLGAATEIPGDDPLARRMRAIAAATDRARPRTPHVYLPSMVVLPAARGFGVGAAMLGHGTHLAAERGLPVYLEASSPDNRRFYARHGFTDLGDPIRVADGAPSLWPMWRAL